MRSGPAARTALRRLLDNAGVRTDVRDTALLLATELLSNAVEHGGGSTFLDATIESEVVRLEVSDHNPRMPSPAADPGELDERGRGMLLIAALSSRWGAERRERGKIVWCEIARA
jgi:anti-sigma regulatory factor (Ser/Thr protein kinase)